MNPNVKDGFGRSPYYYALKVTWLAMQPDIIWCGCNWCRMDRVHVFQGNHTEVMRLLNNDPRHQISTVTEAMLECPLESVDPPLPNTQMAVQPVKNKKGNKGKVHWTETESEIIQRCAWLRSHSEGQRLVLGVAIFVEVRNSGPIVILYFQNRGQNGLYVL